MQETWETRVPSLGREDPLGEGMATPSSILAWRIPWTEEPGRPQSIAEQRVRHNWSDLACTRILDDVEDGPWAFHLFCKDSVSAYWVLPMLFKEIPLLPPPNPPQKKKIWDGSLLSFKGPNDLSSNPHLYPMCSLPYTSTWAVSEFLSKTR